MKQTAKRPFLSQILWGLLAGLLWTAGFFAAFPVFRYAHIFGVIPLGILAGALCVLLLTRRGWKGWLFGALVSGILSLSLLSLLWDLPWLNAMLLVLYQGAHVTEVGFAGLFTILFYVGISLLWFLLLSGVCLAWKNRGSGKKGA